MGKRHNYFDECVTPLQVKKMFNSLARKLHPDKYKDIDNYAFGYMYSQYEEAKSRVTVGSNNIVPNTNWAKRNLSQEEIWDMIDKENRDTLKHRENQNTDSIKWEQQYYDAEHERPKSDIRGPCSTFMDNRANLTIDEVLQEMRMKRQVL
jgi:hypothetical protein